jgi:carboxymethylenebutenolidase
MPDTTLDIPTPGGQTIRGYLAVPAAGHGPGLLLLPESFGINASMRAAADLFAEEGYLVLVPDLFWRLQPGIDLDFDPAGSTKAMEYASRFDVSQGMQDIQAALQVLQARLEHRGKTGVLGFGLGGLLAYLSAVRLPVEAAVAFYGAGIDKCLAEAGNLRCPIVLHFGRRDEHIPVIAVAQIRNALQGRAQVKLYEYPEAGHGFFMPERPAFHPLSSQLAHSRSLTLLRRQLGPEFDLEALWEQHLDWEFNKVSAEGTLTTMTPHPYNLNVPVQTGGNDRGGVLHYYKYQFLGQLPKDARLAPISRTIGIDRVVDEHLLCFTHNAPMDAMLPGVSPTGRAVELAVVVIVIFRGDKVLGEHIYWDQASLLVQIGKLDPAGLPVAGIEVAQRLRDEGRPADQLAQRWPTGSDGRQRRI